MLVAVQVVHQVPVAAVLGDDVDGSCGGTGSGTVPREAAASIKGHESSDRLHVGEAAWYKGEEALAPGKPGFFTCLCNHEQGTEFP